ncbi:MAG: DUF167 domain-containing protein [Candidatus Hermodarchaeia archaeon]|jgi:uncharacterized protein (TIGR00251 family)
MIESHDKGTLLSVRVKTRSKKQGIEINEMGICQVYVKAPPIRGQANAEVVKVIAKRLEIPIEDVRILSGRKSEKKTLLIEGVEPERALAMLQK